MPTSVALSSHFESFLREQVHSGRYNNVSEVVRSALRLLEEQQKREELELGALRSLVSAGLEGQGQDAEMLFKRLESKYSALDTGKD